MSLKRIVYICLVLSGVFSCKKKEEVPLPIANFYVELDSCIDGNCFVSFYDDSDYSVKWNWNFGNGTSSELKNSFSVFNQFITYKIVLEVENSEGLKGEKIKNIKF